MKKQQTQLTKKDFITKKYIHKIKFAHSQKTKSRRYHPKETQDHAHAHTRIHRATFSGGSEEDMGGVARTHTQTHTHTLTETRTHTHTYKTTKSR